MFMVIITTQRRKHQSNAVFGIGDDAQDIGMLLQWETERLK